MEQVMEQTGNNYGTSHGTSHGTNSVRIAEQKRNKVKKQISLFFVVPRNNCGTKSSELITKDEI